VRDLRALVTSMLSAVALVRTPHTPSLGILFLCICIVGLASVSMRWQSLCVCGGGEIVIAVGRRDIIY